MKSKGQALVEFVIILPVFLLLLLGIIDIGKVVYNSNVLEHTLDDVVELYRDGKTYDEIDKFIKANDKSYELQIANDDNKYIELILIKKINLVTPGLNLILDDPYEVEVKRVIDYEK